MRAHSAAFLALLLATSHARAQTAPRVLPLRPDKVEPRKDGRSDLLAGRLVIDRIEKAADTPRAHDIMAAPQSSFVETRIFAESHGRKFVVMAHELFALAPADLAGAVSRTLGQGKYTAASFKVSDPALSAASFGPPEAEFGGADAEAGFLMGLVVAQPDTTLQAIYFYANRPALADGCATFGAREGCTALARKLAHSVSGGTRKLDLSGGVQSIAGVTFELAAGWTASPQLWIDFVTAELQPVRELGAKSAAITIYMGGYPQGASGSELGSGHLLGEKIVWRGHADANGTTRTALVDMGSVRLEVTETAQAPDDLAVLDGVVESMRAPKEATVRAHQEPPPEPRWTNPPRPNPLCLDTPETEYFSLKLSEDWCIEQHGGEKPKYKYFKIYGGGGDQFLFTVDEGFSGTLPVPPQAIRASRAPEGWDGDWSWPYSTGEHCRGISATLANHVRLWAHYCIAAGTSHEQADRAMDDLLIPAKRN